MARKRYSRGKQKGKGKNSPKRKPRNGQPPRRIPRPIKLPEEIKSQIVLLDQDDFFGVYVDLVLFNISKSECIKIPNGKVYKQFKQMLVADKVKDNIYLIDEVYAYGVINLADMIKMIREKDPNAFIVGMTASDIEDITAKESFDQIIAKGNEDHTNSLIQLLSDHYKVEFVEDNSLKEYSGQDYMQQLMDDKLDEFPQKIYRDKGKQKNHEPN